MRFSILVLPDHALGEIENVARCADALDYYAFYCADEIYHKDVWQVLAAIALKTRRIRLGPNATHIILRDPFLIAQQLATLDELSAGRAEGVISLGNPAMLAQLGLSWGSKPIARLREAHAVVRALLDTGVVDFEGDYYTYRGVTTAARPVQEHLPIILGGMRGPRSFELAGEVADGFHFGGAHTREALEHALEHVRIGAQTAQRDLGSFDLGTAVECAVGFDSNAVKEAARVSATFYLAGMPRELIQRHGIAFEDAQPIIEHASRGDLEQAIEAMPAEMADRLSISGTPAECIERIKRDIAAAGYTHVALVFTDPVVIRNLSGQTIESVPSLIEQVQIFHQHVIPAFNRANPGDPP